MEPVDEPRGRDVPTNYLLLKTRRQSPVKWIVLAVVVAALGTVGVWWMSS